MNPLTASHVVAAGVNAVFWACRLGLCLFMAFTAILVLHKHRLIVLRRAFSISGSIFLLRCLTMVVTSLSVPGKHLECKAMSFGETWEEKLGRAWEIGSKFGMTTAGVKTCGDYMFSGHTVAVTLLNFLVTEYVDGGGVKWAGLLLLFNAHNTGMLRVLVFGVRVCCDRYTPKHWKGVHITTW